MHSEQASWLYYCLGIQMQIKKSTYIMDRRGIVIVGRKVEIITGEEEGEGATSGLVKRVRGAGVYQSGYNMFGIMHICTRLLLTTVQKRELI